MALTFPCVKDWRADTSKSSNRDATASNLTICIKECSQRVLRSAHRLIKVAKEYIPWYGADMVAKVAKLDYRGLSKRLLHYIIKYVFEDLQTKSLDWILLCIQLFLLCPLLRLLTSLTLPLKLFCSLKLRFRKARIM